MHSGCPGLVQCEVGWGHSQDIKDQYLLEHPHALGSRTYTLLASVCGVLRTPLQSWDC